MTTINRGRIFSASCVALVVTAMTLGVRAGIMTELAMKFDLTDVQLGWIAGMAFLGFPVATMVGGLIYNFIGPKKLMYIAFAGHLLGLILTITASGFWTLIISTFCIGFANGSVEAACNPLIADIYHKNKTTMLNRFHVWFPYGIVIGALMSAGLSQLGMGWEIKIAIMLLPTIVYGYMIFGQTFPEMENTEVDTAINLRALFTPLYIFMLICMTLTATTELGTQQWIERILGNSGAHPMLILAMVTGLMAVGRYFAGPIIHAFNPAGVLLFSAIMAFLGIYLMSIASGPLVYAAAIIFALGVTYFWPTMIGFIGENCPKTGALGMSLIGGVGMFSVSMWSPVIGGWLESARADALANGLVGEAAELAAGQSTLANISLFPIVLIVLFTGLLIYKRKFASK